MGGYPWKEKVEVRWHFDGEEWTMDNVWNASLLLASPGWRMAGANGFNIWGPWPVYLLHGCFHFTGTTHLSSEALLYISSPLCVVFCLFSAVKRFEFPPSIFHTHTAEPPQPPYIGYPSGQIGLWFGPTFSHSFFVPSFRVGREPGEGAGYQRLPATKRNLLTRTPSVKMARSGGWWLLRYQASCMETWFGMKAALWSNSFPNPQRSARGRAFDFRLLSPELKRR